MLKFFLTILVLASTVLGYGWWHASTHASFHGDFRLLGTQMPGRRKTDSSGQAIPIMAGAKVAFIAANGEVLANGTNDSKHNYLHLIHPAVGDCHKIERAAATSRKGRIAWQDCYEELSIWTSTWIKKVKQVVVTDDGCSYGAIPVEASEYYADWYLWWVPLPHIGGSPYTHYRLSINIDKKDCNA